VYSRCDLIKFKRYTELGSKLSTNLISALQSPESPKRQKYTNQYDLYRVGGDVKHYSIQSNTPTRMKNEKN